MKLTNHACACNDLTGFEYVEDAMTVNGSYVNLLKLAWKNSWNHIKWITFSVSFSCMKPLCAGPWNGSMRYFFLVQASAQCALFSIAITFYVIARFFLGLFLRILSEKDIPCLCCKFFFFMRKKNMYCNLILNLNFEKSTGNSKYYAQVIRWMFFFCL